MTADAWDIVEADGDLWIACNGLRICRLNAALRALGTAA